MSNPATSSEENPPDQQGLRDGAVVRSLCICNRKGLHARASAKFVRR